MRTNKPVIHQAQTHEGGIADPHQTPLEELRRAVSTCLLFENTFYEIGNDLAVRIAGLCQQVGNEEIAALAQQARTDLKLRHVPLFLCVQLARKRWNRLAPVLTAVIQRPDELAEFLSLYWQPKRQPLSKQVKKGLALAFQKFSAFQLAKWNRPDAVKLRDVLFMCHAKPKDQEQDATWKRLIAGTLDVPDTWEVALSGGADKKATFERLLSEKKLGYMALLMNVRNMSESGVQQELVERALREGAKGSKALPFRFIAAYKHAPQYAQALSDAMELAVEGILPGTTALVVDVSGSMLEALSGKGETKRWEAAAGLTVLLRKLCASCRVFTYSTSICEVPGLRGMGLVEVIKTSVGGGTNTAAALACVRQTCPELQRVILLTDEQSHDGIIPNWARYGYLINVAPYKPGLETNRHGWARINGWSDRIVDWMQRHEEYSAGNASDGEPAPTASARRDA